jgi:hypothetical protein
MESLRDSTHAAGPAIRPDDKHTARVLRARELGVSLFCCKRRISIGKIEIVVAGAGFRHYLSPTRASASAALPQLPAKRVISKGPNRGSTFSLPLARDR